MSQPLQNHNDYSGFVKVAIPRNVYDLLQKLSLIPPITSESNNATTIIPFGSSGSTHFHMTSLTDEAIMRQSQEENDLGNCEFFSDTLIENLILCVLLFFEMTTDKSKKNVNASQTHEKIKKLTKGKALDICKFVNEAVTFWANFYNTPAYAHFQTKTQGKSSNSAHLLCTIIQHGLKQQDCIDLMSHFKEKGLFNHLNISNKKLLDCITPIMKLLSNQEFYQKFVESLDENDPIVQQFIYACVFLIPSS